MADPATWHEWIKVAAFVFGLLFGGLAIGSPAWVWLSKQVLTATAGLLAVLGTVLISMSIWQSVEIEAAGLRVRIAELTDALRLQVASDTPSPEIMENLSENKLTAAIMMGAGVAQMELPSEAFRSNPELQEAYNDYVSRFRALSTSAEALKKQIEVSDAAAGTLKKLLDKVRTLDSSSSIQSED